DLRQIVLSPGTSPTVASNWRVSRIAGSDSGGKGTGDGVGTTARFDIPLDLVYDGNTVTLVDYSTNTLRRIISTTGFPVPSNGGSSTTEKVVMANADGIVAGSQNSYLAYDEGIPSGASSPTRDWAFTIPDGVTAFQFTVTVEGGTETPAGLAAIKRASGGAGSPDNMVSTAAGSVTEAAYVNGALPSARFNTLFGVALDAQGNAFVSDILNNAIRRIGTDGIVSTVAGMPGNNIGYADGTGLTAEISYPGGLAVNDSGTLLYVADSYGNTIRRIALTGSDPAQPGDWTVTTIAGSAGEYGNSDGIGASARFFGPYAITMGKGNVLYVSESAGRRIRRLDPVGSDLSLPTSWRVTTLAGSTYGQSGYLDATGPAALFYEPLGIALDQAGNVLVCDQQRLRKVTPAGVVTTVAGSGGTGAVDAVGTAATFTDLTAVAVDSAGYIYVTGNDMRIRRISPQAAVTTVAGTGVSGNTDGPGHTAKFQPYCGTMNFDTQGTLWRTVGNTLKKVQRIITKP
ncbi:MAG TPA: hypothetical protein VK934_01465, partial [Fimbriimonas sp.]|nr:hypothetical protein [Fimbriimonas sp.]